MYWYLGFTLFFIGNVSNFISMGFTAQSLLAGLGSIQFITNVLCSALILKHPVTGRVLWATFAIVVGNVLIVAFASHHSDQLTVDQLWLLYTDNPPYQIYCVVLVVLVLILYIYYKVLHTPNTRSAERGTTPVGRYRCPALPRCAHRHPPLSVVFASASQETKKHLKTLHQHPMPGTLAYKLLPFSYAAISAIIGTQSVLLAKSSSELVRTTLGGNNQFYSPFTYFILMAWITSMVFWLYRMNAALRKFDGVFIIPVLQVVWTLFSIVGGGVYFREFSKFDRKDTALFTLGVCVVIFGVYLLAPHPPRPVEEDEEAGGQEERVFNISSHASHDTEMASLHASHPPLQGYQIRQLLAQQSPPHKYAVVATHSRPSSAQSPAASQRSFSFSSDRSGSDSQTDPDSPTSSDSSPERHSLSPSTPTAHTPPPPVQIVIQHDEGKVVMVGPELHSGSEKGGYGGVDEWGDGGITPKRTRSRGMSLGLAIPLVEFDVQPGDRV